MSHRVVLCEGFDDRNFWSGLAKHRLQLSPVVMQRPDGRAKLPGEFDYRLPSGDLLRIVPGTPAARTEGRSMLLERLFAQLKNGGDDVPARILVNVDGDVDAPATFDGSGWLDSFAQTQREPWFSGFRSGSAWSFKAADGQLVAVDVAVWQVAGGDTSEPSKQVLERLICHALAAKDPARARSITAWLSSPPMGTPITNAKAHAYAHLAKWHTDEGCQQFYEAVWRDPDVSTALEAILTAAGTWNAIQRIVT